MTTEFDPTYLTHVLEAAIETGVSEPGDDRWWDMGHFSSMNMSSSEAEFIALCSPTFIRALVERCQELEKDRERLDWLLENGASVGSFTGGRDWVVFNEEGDIMHCNWQLTPRAAIDAARQQREREGGE